MVTNAGGGYSRRHDLAMTRWREDITTDEWGSFCYVRDLDSGRVWSTTHQPIGPRRRRVRGDLRARSRRLPPPRRRRSRSGPKSSSRRKTTSELRRVSVTNHSDRAAHARRDQLRRGRAGAAGRRSRASGVLSNLFVETRAVPRARRADLRSPAARRRQPPATSFTSSADAAALGARDAVRNRSRALHRPRPDAGAADRAVRPIRCRARPVPVLDPIVALRQIDPPAAGRDRAAAFTTGFADSESDALRLIDSTTIAGRSRARWRSPARTARSSCATSA